MTEEVELLSKGQQRALDDALAGRNLFITGAGGVGKSFLIDIIKKKLEEKGKSVALTSSTGISAINIGGNTIHSFCGTGVRSNIYQIKKMPPETIARVRNFSGHFDVVIVDEVSMLSGDYIDMMDVWFQRIWKQQRAFGGRQMIFVGDFCLKNGTKIIMANGKTKNIEDIVVGEKVMGPDSAPREVKRIFKGVSDLYEVNQTNGDNYITTPNHTLVLKRRGNSNRYKNEGDVVNISVKDFLNKSCKFKEVFGGFKCSCLKYEEKEVKVDPYYLGLWLGDGEKSSCRITSMDNEIMTFCEEYAKNMNLKCKLRKENKKTKAFRISITTEEKTGKWGRNTLLNNMRYYDVINNKHIPDDYMFNSEEVRLNVLAGLLDTDGCLSDNRFTITLSNEKLARHVKMLADQLGFRTHMKYNLKQNKYHTWYVSIGGQINRIPTKIKRKIVNCDKFKSNLNSTINVEYHGVGNFSGIEVSGDNLFLLEDCTVLHNCQLPPVITKDDMVDYHFAFESDSWLKYDIREHFLTKVFRQEDKETQYFLNCIRFGKVNKKVLDFFNKRVGVKLDEKFPTQLYPLKKSVSDINFKRLSNLKGEEHEYYASFTGEDCWQQAIAKNTIAEICLYLKEGASVLFIKNNPTCGYYNGMKGTVVKCKEESVIVATSDGEEIEVVPETWEKKSNDGQILATMKQIPLILGWALTIHKSQGMTLDWMKCDLSLCFECGQAYVALSRIRNMDGLSIQKPIRKEHIKTSKKVIKYYRHLLTQLREEKEKNKV